MKKISKSDKPIDREEEQAEKNWLDNLPKSQHFAIGTGVMCKGRTGVITEILVCPGRALEWCDCQNALRIEWEDGTMGVLTPFALNRKAN